MKNSLKREVNKFEIGFESRGQNSRSDNISAAMKLLGILVQF